MSCLSIPMRHSMICLDFLAEMKNSHHALHDGSTSPSPKVTATHIAEIARSTANNKY